MDRNDASFGGQKASHQSQPENQRGIYSKSTFDLCNACILPPRCAGYIEADELVAIYGPLALAFQKDSRLCLQLEKRLVNSKMLSVHF